MARKHLSAIENQLHTCIFDQITTYKKLQFRRVFVDLLTKKDCSLSTKPVIFPTNELHFPESGIRWSGEVGSGVTVFLSSDSLEV